MKKFMLGRKVAMTQFFAEDGKAHAATLVSVEPNTVLRVKTQESDGYGAVQVGFGKRKEKHVNKAQKSEWGTLGLFAEVREFRVDDPSSFTRGDILEAQNVFEAGDKVVLAGTSKGKGFQGVVKRHGFSGGRRSHGQKHEERAPGSIGATGPQRVFKGTRMAGRMGGDRVTVKNLVVLGIDPEAQVLIIKGAVPGRRGTLLEIRG